MKEQTKSDDEINICVDLLYKIAVLDIGNQIFNIDRGDLQKQIARASAYFTDAQKTELLSKGYIF